MKYSKELHEKLRAGYCGINYVQCLLDEIDRLNAERRWIPVSAGLLPDPDEQELVLCYAPNFASTEIRWTDEIGEAITHWMPLPPAPESEGE